MHAVDRNIIRILDANLNRATEALRVIEEYARFVLDDREAASEFKRLRHELHAAVAGERLALLEARDVASDVGRELKTPTELDRATPLDVVRAEFSRLSQSARALAEYGKLVSPRIVAAAESLRYRGYGLEQSLLMRGDLRRQMRAVRLYVIITAEFCRGDWLKTADAALYGGAKCLQLREKSLSDAELLRRAIALRELTRTHGALFCINDRPDIARLADADVVHVGQDDLSVAQVRRVAGPRVLVGKSTHTRDQIDAALLEQPDYIAVGPMFATTTKPQEHIAGPETLAHAASRTNLPLVAIGGITADRAEAVWRAGATCICACAAVISSADAEAAARALLRHAPPITRVGEE